MDAHGVTTTPNAQNYSLADEPTRPRQRRRRVRWWHIGVTTIAVIASTVAINAGIVSDETRPAHADIGRIVRVLGHSLQVREDGPHSGPPIVLIHRFAGSIHEWDEIVPELAKAHRVIRTDLLGHGGSEKPGSGYSIEGQARLVAAVLDKLGVRKALVVGHSMGGDVAVALATARRDLVQRLVVIDANPEWRFFTLPSSVERTLRPVIGQLQWQLAPDSMIRKSVQREFAPGFRVPQHSVRDVRRMTYTSYTDSLEDFDRYLDAIPLNKRIAQLGMPILVLWGDHDQLVKPTALNDYRRVAGARIVMVAGAGHSAMIERPAESARLILGWETSPCAAVHGAVLCSFTLPRSTRRRRPTSSL
jgi:pimeloyl-ACP methyl ester carboxylesterase